jgi:hypothetical protein
MGNKTIFAFIQNREIRFNFRIQLYGIPGIENSKPEIPAEIGLGTSEETQQPFLAQKMAVSRAVLKKTAGNRADCSPEKGRGPELPGKSLRGTLIVEESQRSHIPQFEF